MIRVEPLGRTYDDLRAVTFGGWAGWTQRWLEAPIVNIEATVITLKRSVPRIEGNRADKRRSVVAASVEQVRQIRQRIGQRDAKLAGAVRLGIRAGEESRLRGHRLRRLGICLDENHALF